MRRRIVGHADQLVHRADLVRSADGTQHACPSTVADSILRLMYIVMAHIVMACIVMAYIVMACIVMAHVVMACFGQGAKTSLCISLHLAGVSN